ncbi:MAG: glycoside hydrolase family 127 protein, partial [Alphaproteobacteria bacterium]|nr:glycoside hydrolase family 127 protein [Alphaproteobacteria bacterium]
MSRYAPVNFPDVKLEGKFWHERLETVLTRTIPSQHSKLSEYTILDSIKLPQPPPPLRFPRHANGFTVQVFWDSDVGKWIEAASYALAHRRDAEVEAKIEAIVDDFEKAQAPDGYLNCWYLGREPEKRFTNLRDNHEFYNAGHLLEGAVAYFQVTGRRRWLDIMERYLDHIYSVFGTGPGQKRGYDGHEEIELALMKLYYLTGEKKHLDFVTYLINERGRQPHYFDLERLAREGGDSTQPYVFANYEYSQSHKPVREQDKVVGHAVRAMYLYTAMADLAAEIDDAALKHACEVLWDDVMETKMYVTAGLGPSAHNEGFTHDFDLPNQTAYAETCASVALIFWAQRMLHLDLDGKYADILELAMFNGALSGLSRDGEHYFYANPLESDGTPTRWDWHTCPCCTMNVSRLVASVGGYFVSTASDGVAFHLYGGIATTAEIA